MYNLITLAVLLVFQTSETRLKPSEEYNIAIDYAFKQRPPVESGTFEFENDPRKTGTAQLPHLGIKLKFLKLNEAETKVKVINKAGQIIVNRRAVVGEVVPIVWGFMDDIKDNVISNEIYITLMSPKKEETSKITLLIQEDGTFLVNGEKRGKF